MTLQADNVFTDVLVFILMKEIDISISSYFLAHKTAMDLNSLPELLSF